MNKIKMLGSFAGSWSGQGPGEYAQVTTCMLEMTGALPATLQVV